MVGRTGSVLRNVIKIGGLSQSSLPSLQIDIPSYIVVYSCIHYQIQIVIDSKNEVELDDETHYQRIQEEVLERVLRNDTNYFPNDNGIDRCPQSREKFS